MVESTTIPNRRLLVVDDTRAIHEDFGKIFGSAQGNDASLAQTEAALFGSAAAPERPPLFDFDSAFQGQEALALAQRARAEGRPYAMAFVDVRMPPGWDGVETTARLWEADPDLQVVICTAYSDYSWEDMIARLGQTDRLVILKKPFDNMEVLQLAHALTEKWRLLQQARAKAGQLEQMVSAQTLELRVANEKLRAEIAERAKVESALRQSQKMDALGQLAGGVAHDFNNLLTVIRGYTHCLVADGRQTPKALEALRQVDEAAQRASALTCQLLAFSRKQCLQPQAVSLNEIVTQLGRMLRRLLSEDIHVNLQCAPAAPTIHADRAMIEQVLLNLTVNARDAMPQGGELSIQVTELEIDDEHVRQNPRARAGRFACLSVTDTGCGIAPENLPHLFEPFFTTKEVGQGTGLGLATVYGIVKQHHGWVEVESAPGQGAAFRVFLPVSPAAVVPAAPVRPAKEVECGNEVILLVEDEEALREMALAILQRHGYRVHPARSGAHALAVWEAHGAEVNLLLTDMVMPEGVSGRELARRLRQNKSDLRVAYTTGYDPEIAGDDCPLLEGINFLPKPYTPNSLIRMVRRCLDEPLPAGPAEGGRPTRSTGKDAAISKAAMPARGAFQASPNL